MVQEKQNAEAITEYSSVVVVAKYLQECLGNLDIQVGKAECENLSCFLNQVYSTRNRAFHDVSHAIEVGEGASPIGQLAALFHDVVYIQVDRSRLPELRSLFGVFDPCDKLELELPSEETLARDPWRKAVVTLFGFSAGQRLGVFSGLNEFLSAWITLQKIRTFLTNKQVLQIITCIEATIPFRADQEGITVVEKLRANLVRAGSILRVEFDEAELDFAVREAVRVSNNDVRGFGLQEPEVFIYNSWALLYENNPSLQNNLFSVVKYREPLQKLEAFLGGMSSKKLFLSYKGYPGERKLQELLDGAAINLRVGREYVRAKILDTAIIEAFAVSTVGDCPLELFTGPRPKNRESKTARIEEYLDQNRFRRLDVSRDEKVVRLLSEGRAFRSRFDMKTSIFASFIYQALNPSQFESSYTAAKEFLGRQLSAELFLGSLPPELLQYIGNVLSQVAWTRSAAILEFVSKLRREEAA